jgi:hypothetical protein
LPLVWKFVGKQELPDYDIDIFEFCECFSLSTACTLAQRVTLTKGNPHKEHLAERFKFKTDHQSVLDALVEAKAPEIECVAAYMPTV